jgi:hypothetical protein
MPGRAGQFPTLGENNMRRYMTVEAFQVIHGTGSAAYQDLVAVLAMIEDEF